ncbi:hypothetical protein DL770_010430 [Monosporascus sp. CRB-9-2]|nr:hypothetical protein DL770_010430 [Monosporascus sp. CRB-9-2]
METVDEFLVRIHGKHHGQHFVFDSDEDLEYLGLRVSESSSSQRALIGALAQRHGLDLQNTRPAVQNPQGGVSDRTGQALDCLIYIHDWLDLPEKSLNEITAGFCQRVKKESGLIDCVVPECESHLILRKLLVSGGFDRIDLEYRERQTG